MTANRASGPDPELELYDARRDPEPSGWTDFLAVEHVPGTWDYTALNRASLSWSPVLLGVWRGAGGRIVGAVGAVYRGLGTTRPPRRWEPTVLDVRLPGEGHGPTWHFGDGVPDASRPRLLRAFERAAAHRLGPGLTGAVYRNVGVPQLAWTARKGAVVRDSTPTAELPLAWNSAEEWTRSLPRKRRQDLRRQEKRIAADPGLSVAMGRARTDLDHTAMAGRVAGQIARHSGRFDRRDPPPPDYFAALCRRDDVSTLTYTATHDGRLLAFCTFLHHPALPRLGWWGSMPPEEGGRKHLYFDMYLRYVEYAIALGGTRLSAGRAEIDIKRSLGFEAVPMKLVLVPRWSLGRAPG